jgi:hypothetical protein
LGSMISVPEACSGQNSVFSRLAGAAIALLFLSACGPNQVIVEGKFPAPLMTELPLTIGIWYPQEFRNHEFTDIEKPARESKWIVKTGEAQVQMWDTVLAGMFRNFVEMKAAPGPEVMNQVVDAVLIPHIDELQYAIPTQTHIKVYEIWMRYRFELVTRTGEPIAQWMMTAYGKTPTAFMQSDTGAVNLAAVMALRDAGANFVTGFTRVPELREWLDTKWPKPIEPQP